jgi:cytidyltransferase-like protein
MLKAVYYVEVVVLVNVVKNLMDKLIVDTKQKALEVLQNKEFVLVTGSFDVMHIGHIQLLEYAKTCTGKSNFLVVILINDNDITSRKGDNRPVFDHDARCRVISALKDVDLTIKWQESWQNLREFVLQTKPKAMVVVDGDSGMNNKKEIIERAGGSLYVYQKQKNISTTDIINKIVNWD